MINVPREQFEDLVGEALDGIPEVLTALLRNVVIIVEDDPPADEPGLLGLYTGIPLTERDGSYFGALPDCITIYRRPTMAICEELADVIEEVRITVVHEVAHHFGIDDDRLHELGYD